MASQANGQAMCFVTVARHWLRDVKTKQQWVHDFGVPLPTYDAPEEAEAFNPTLLLPLWMQEDLRGMMPAPSTPASTLRSGSSWDELPPIQDQQTTPQHKKDTPQQDATPNKKEQNNTPKKDDKPQHEEDTPKQDAPRNNEDPGTPNHTPNMPKPDTPNKTDKPIQKTDKKKPTGKGAKEPIDPHHSIPNPPHLTKHNC